jgi:topoisomerase IV subunit A
MENLDITAYSGDDDSLVSVTGMYREYFLDYASYVILERAVPHLNDGFKPVQRRILHAMKQMDDGRFHKVANIIGQTMAYHPHGDAAIGDALVNLGQKDLLIECQGNWGDVRTGDSAAAPRYIEARLSKFALEVCFNPQTTEWQLTYDGRKKEPVTLPVKFPMVLSMGVEGIAVGLATKILPHNFIELIKASIKVLEGKKAVIYPDFITGGLADVAEYNDGLRGGRIKCRARIRQEDKNTLIIHELPFGVTTGSIIDSILKATEKGQIKVKKVIDNTARDVEVLVELAPGTSPDLTIDALYAFTDCEVSISPNCCIIIDNKPHFMGVSEILKISTEQTKELLRLELLIKKAELEEKWHLSSLEKIFIEKRIYRDIEECESFEEVIEVIDAGLKKYVATPSDPLIPGDNRLMMMRDITRDDIIKLTEIRIKRISKYNSFKADEYIKGLESELEQVVYDLAHLTDFAIKYFNDLLEKYGKGKERKTEISSFDNIQVQTVVANNAKLYVNREDGFIGIGMKKDEFLCDCSDIDDVIAFTKDGFFKVVRIADKVFIGKNIIHAAVWKKGDERTTYNLVYLDGKSGVSYAKRFNVSAITRDKEYPLTQGEKASRILYFSVQPNGESEVLNVVLSPGCSARNKVLDFDLAEIGIKGRSSKGNIVTKYPVRKVTQISVGKSSLGAMEAWMDKVSGRLNNEERGLYLGAFDTGGKILAIYSDGSYELTDFDMMKRFDVNNLMAISKFNSNIVVSAVYFDPEKNYSLVKRFKIETSTLDQKFVFLPETKGVKLYFASMAESPEILYKVREGKETIEKATTLTDIVDVKGWKALGNKLTDGKIVSIKDITPLEEKKTEEEYTSKENTKSDTVQGDLFGNAATDNSAKDKLKAGDSIDFDL